MLAASGCDCGGADESAAATASNATASAGAAVPSTAAADAGAPDAPKPTAEQLSAWKQCAERQQAVLDEKPLPGAPEFEKKRVHMARVRGRALLWRRAPQADSPKLDERVAKSKTALQAVKDILYKHKQRDQRRELLLREGYLYHENVEVALALVEMIGLTQLYGEATLFLQRGAQLYELERLERTRYLPVRYGYQNGPLKGETAEILFGDRVGTDREKLESDPLVVDLRDASRRGQFDRLKPIHLTDKALAAELRYGPETWVPALFELTGARADLSCEALTEELWNRKRVFVEQQALRRRALAQLRRVIHEQVREQIPFDAAPDNENGFLRRAWERAYFRKWRRFTHRDRKFDVYNAAGQPIPPQVCIDFLTDTWERAAGSWFAPLSGDPPRPHPERTPGPIDFEKLEDLDNRRSVAEFVKYTKKHPELFDTWDIPNDERVAFKQREPFFEYLAANADRFLPGDVVILHGYKEGGRPHYHSLFILETDPVNGVPTRVAGNAVIPREQTLEGIMQISPKRSIRHRIRLREPWLKLIAAGAPGAQEPAGVGGGTNVAADAGAGDDQGDDDGG